MKQPYPLINTEKKFILFTNAKCGGTTLKSWFIDSLELENTFSDTLQALKHYGFYFVFKWYKFRFANHELENIKFYNPYLRRFVKIYRKATYNKIKKHLRDPDFLRVAVTRNPYDRLVSGFVDKFCGEDLHRPWVQEVIKQANTRDAEGNYGISFSQFVDYLYARDLRDVNAHWRNQTHNLNEVELDEIIDLSDMSSKLPALSKSLGIDTNIVFDKRRQSNSYKKSKSANNPKAVYDISNKELIKFKEEYSFFPDKDAFYNENIKQKVREIYKYDFEMLNYD